MHTDQVFRPQKLTDASGVVVWDRVETPFGVEVSTTGGLTQPVRFPGQVEDLETALNQNWNRDYDPLLGRYIQSDPIGLMGGINTYAYVEGNPLTAVDPTGEVPIFAIPFACAGGGCQAAVAAGIGAAGAIAVAMSTPEGRKASDRLGAAVCSNINDRCEALNSEIDQLVNELKKREFDLIENRLNLPLSGRMSIDGHKQQFQGKQRRLRRTLFEAAATGCKVRNPDAWRTATKGTPSPR